jgi:hypothetical protein
MTKEKLIFLNIINIPKILSKCRHIHNRKCECLLSFTGDFCDQRVNPHCQDDSSCNIMFGSKIESNCNIPFDRTRQIYPNLFHLQVLLFKLIIIFLKLTLPTKNFMI